MQPQQPNSPSTNSNPYEFILNPTSPQKPKSPFSLNSGSPKGKIMLVLGIGLTLLITVFLGITVLGGSNDSAGDLLLDVLQQQTEIARVAEQGTIKARQSKTQALASNVKLSIVSAQQQILPLAKKRGIKTDAKQLGLKKNATTDKKLQAAAENGQFDSVFTQSMSEQLSAYKNSLNSAYTKVTSQKDKVIIKSSYDGAALLLNSIQTN